MKKLKKGVFIFLMILLIVPFVSSCDEKQIDEHAKKDNPQQEDDDVHGETPTEIEKTIKSCIISASKTDNIYYVNDTNGLLSLQMHYYNSDGDEVEGETTWNTDIPEGVDYTNEKNLFTIDLNTIKVLGDYTVTGMLHSSKKLTKSFSFTVLSKDELANSLSYSFASGASMQVDFSEDEIAEIKKITEYDSASNKIEKNADRMMVGGNIVFYPNGTNMIYLTQKDNTNLGALDYEVISGTGVKVYKTTENGFLIQAEEKEQLIELAIKAGTKDAVDMKIETKLDSPASLATPNVSEPYNAEAHAGKIVGVSGDNIVKILSNLETDEQEDETFSSGNTLTVKVERRNLNSEDAYESYPYYENEESAIVEGGMRIHLKHEGSYRITAKISDAVMSSRANPVYVDIEPIKVQEVIKFTNPATPYVAIETVNSQDKWDDYATGSTVPRDSYYDITVTNSYEGGKLLVEEIFVSKDISCDSYNNRTELRKGESYRIKYHYAGIYTIKATHSGGSGGYGELYGVSDIPDEYAEVKTYEISPAASDGTANYVDVILNQAPGSETVSYTVKSSLSASTRNQSCITYVAVYRNQVFETSYALHPQESFTVDNSGYDVVTLKSYVWCSEEMVPSDIVVYGTAKPAFNAKAKTIYNDDIQDRRNARKAVVTNTKDRNGKFRTLYYSWDNVNYVVLGNSESYSIYLVNSSELATELKSSGTICNIVNNTGGEKKLYIKTIPNANEEVAAGSYSVVSLTMKLTKLDGTGIVKSDLDKYWFTKTWSSYYRVNPNTNKNVPGVSVYAESTHAEKSSGVTGKSPNTTTSTSWIQMHSADYFIIFATIRYRLEAYVFANGYIDSDPQSVSS